MNFKNWFIENFDQSATKIHQTGDGSGWGSVRIGTGSSNYGTGPFAAFKLFYNSNWGDWQEIERAAANDTNLGDIIRSIQADMEQTGYPGNAGKHAKRLQLAAAQSIQNHGYRSANRDNAAFDNARRAKPKDLTRVNSSNQTMQTLISKYREIDTRLKRIEARFNSLPSERHESPYHL